MILSETDVLKIANNPVDGVIAVNRELQDEHKVHVTGEGVESKIRHNSEYESGEEFKERKQDVKPFTRLITNKIIEAQSRWKSAQGTTRSYDYGKEGQEKADKFKKNVLEKCWKGKSIEYFIYNFQDKAIYTEFNGFYLVEKPLIQNIEGKTYQIVDGIHRQTEEKPVPYITFKSVDEVHDFRMTGDRVEWISFKYEHANKDVKCLRIIDDVKDYIVEIKGSVASISVTYPPIEHKAGKCPVVRVSTLRKKIDNDRIITSPIDNLIAPLDGLLSQHIDHVTTARKHTFPIRYQVGQTCNYSMPETNAKCNNGMIYYEENGVPKELKCNHCDGKGVIKTSVSTVILVPSTDNEGKAFNIDNVAGYVTPELENFREQRIDIDWKEQKILASGLGVDMPMAEGGINKTATEAIINTKPLEDIICENIDIIESVERELTDLLGKMYDSEAYKGCEIIYGRKLNLRDENTILDEIEKSKKVGLFYSHIKTLNIELVYSRYIRSNYDLQRNLILIELEPMAGYSFDEVEKSSSLNARAKLFKQNFNDLITKFEVENGDIVDFMPETKIFVEKIKAIASKLNTYLDEIDPAKNKEGAVNEQQAKAQAELRGSVGGVQGLVSISTAVSLGQMTEEAGVAIIETVYGYPHSEAVKMCKKAIPTNVN